MDKKNLSGIKFSFDSSEKALGNTLLSLVITIFAYESFICAFFSMLEIKINFLCCLLPVIIIIALHLSENKRKFFAALNIAAIAVCAILILSFGITVFSNGAKLIFNQIFEISEKYQAYSYNRFEILSDTHSSENCKTIFLLVISMLFSQIISYAVLKSKKIIISVIFAAVIIFEVYFGISPEFIWNITLFAALFLTFLLIYNGNKKQKIKNIQNIPAFIQTAALLALTIVICVCVIFAAYPEEYRNSNPAVTQINEQIRDLFDEGEQKISNMINPSASQSTGSKKADSAKSDKGSGAKKEKGNVNGPGGNQKRASNASTVSINIVTAAIAAMLASVIIIWLIIFILKSAKRRKMLNSADINSVINYAFNSAFSWLTASGLKSKNIMPSDYTAEIAELISQPYADDYSAALSIWQESIYSNNNIKDDQKEQIVSFYNGTKKLVWKKASVLQKLVIKFIRFL